MKYLKENDCITILLPNTACLIIFLPYDSFSQDYLYILCDKTIFFYLAVKSFVFSFSTHH